MPFVGRVVDLTLADGSHVEARELDCVGRTFVALFPFPDENNMDLNVYYVRISAIRSIQPNNRPHSRNGSSNGTCDVKVDSAQAALHAVRKPFRLRIAGRAAMDHIEPDDLEMRSTVLVMRFLTTDVAHPMRTVEIPFDSILSIEGEAPSK